MGFDEGKAYKEVVMMHIAYPSVYKMLEARQWEGITMVPLSPASRLDV